MPCGRSDSRPCSLGESSWSSGLLDAGPLLRILVRRELSTGSPVRSDEHPPDHEPVPTALRGYCGHGIARFQPQIHSMGNQTQLGRPADALFGANKHGFWRSSLSFAETERVIHPTPIPRGWFIEMRTMMHFVAPETEPDARQAVSAWPGIRTITPLASSWRT